MNAEEMFDGKVIRAKYIVEHYIESGITTWIYIPEEKKEIKMSETNLEHYKEQLKEILLVRFDNPRGVIKKIGEIFGCQIKVERGEYATDALLEWMAQPYREPILDDAEKKYLSEVIRPFKNNVIGITKVEDDYEKGKYYIRIIVRKHGEEYINLPWFDENTMYKGMKENKEYTVKELGLC